MNIHASLSSADPLQLGAAVDRLVAAGVDGIHVDICDGVFAPGVQGGAALVAAVAQRARPPVWVHLMVSEPEPLLPEVAAAGAAGVTVHLEASAYPWRLRALADRLRLHFGLALNPSTPLAHLEAAAGVADVVSLLTTETDGAGERFLPGMVARVARARWLLRGKTLLEVDGGVDADVAARLDGTPDRLVVGRAILAARDAAAAVAALRGSSRRASA